MSKLCPRKSFSHIWLLFLVNPKNVDQRCAKKPKTGQTYFLSTGALRLVQNNPACVLEKATQRLLFHVFCFEIRLGTPLEAFATWWWLLLRHVVDVITALKARVWMYIYPLLCFTEASGWSKATGVGEIEKHSCKDAAWAGPRYRSRGLYTPLSAGAAWATPEEKVLHEGEATMDWVRSTYTAQTG